MLFCCGEMGVVDAGIKFLIGSFSTWGEMIWGGVVSCHVFCSSV